MPYGLLLSLSKVKLKIEPRDFWLMTFGEWWPIFNAVEGKTIKPLSKREFASLEDQWKNGNS